MNIQFEIGWNLTLFLLATDVIVLLGFMVYMGQPEDDDE